MASDTVTLRLNGRITVADFATAISGFNALLAALTDEVAQGAVDWEVSELERSSATATARGFSRDPSKVSRVVGAYGAVGSAAEDHAPIPYAGATRTATGTILSVLKGGIGGVETIDFETAEIGATVGPQGRPIVVPKIGAVPRHGAVTGRVQTLTNRGSLRFTLYDLLHDKAVSCYLAEGREAIMRDAWGRLAVVEGIVTRDELTGRPKVIRNVTRITLRPDGQPNTYLLARGASPSESGLSAADAIRRVRDA